MDYYCPRCEGKEVATPVKNKEGKKIPPYKITLGEGYPEPITDYFHMFNCEKCDKRFGVENADLD